MIDKFSVKRIKSITESVENTNALSELPGLILFLDLYISSEILSKKVIDFFRIDENKKPLSINESWKIDELKRALKHFGVIYTDDILNDLFLTTRSTLGQKSARNIRNSVLHNKNSNDINQLCSQFEEIINKLEYFIGLFKTEETL